MLTMAGVVVAVADRCLVAFAADASTQTRVAEELGKNMIRVSDFGARGDGRTDDTAAVIAADAAAAAARKPLFFPAGVYAIEPIEARTSWMGAGSTRSILRYRGRATTFVNLVSASRIDRIRFVDLGFDGAASTDPISWDARNYNRFTGCAGLSIDSCRDARILRCRATNTFAHGFRLLKVRGGEIRDCSTRRSRGVFGDGFLILSSIDTLVTDCTAQDYTRIGIVADRTDVTEPLCQQLTIRNCRSEFGHHASSIYGGSEFNAGVWIENCTSSTIEGVHASGNTHRGISVCSGKITPDFAGNRALINIRNCKTKGGEFGITTYSLIDLPITATVTECDASSALIAFQGTANTGKDEIIWTYCRADYNASATNGRGFATDITSKVDGRPTFTVGKGCTISRWSQDMRKLEDGGAAAATADIGGYYYPAGAMRLIVEGVRQVDRGPVFVRWYNDQPHDVRLSDVDAYVSDGGGSGTTVTARNARIRTRPTV